MVEGIPAASYTTSDLNKGYALKAVGMLRQEPALSGSALALWRAVQEGGDKVHNGQMDVVIALWNGGFLL